jgi:flagellum-specific ATP synthase
LSEHDRTQPFEQATAHGDAPQAAARPAASNLPPRLARAVQRASSFNRPLARGQVRAVNGLSIECVGLRCGVGDLCQIESREGAVPAEVVGFDGDTAVLMALAESRGVTPLDPVHSAARPLLVTVGEGLLGRVVDALGRPLDGGPPLVGPQRPILGDAPPALSRKPIHEPMRTGVSAIDGFLTLGKGQRIGIFAGSGVGKSTLLGQLARNADADVSVIALIGERGREVQEFLTDVLGPEGLARSVVVVATSDMPPMLRHKGPFTAVAIAEAFRRQGQDVLFVMDSVTRFAGAAREIGLSAGEPPTLRGYPPSLFAQLPRLVERLGNDAHGTMTALLTVLVDGGDFDEPVSDALRGYLDGHIVLSRDLADRGRFPAIDVLGSISRLDDQGRGPRTQGRRDLLAPYARSLQRES